MSRNIRDEVAASSAPRNGPSTYSLFSAASSEDLLDGLEDFPLVPDTSLIHATTSVPYEDANDSLKSAFLEMGSPAASATPGSSGLRSFAHEQQVYLDQQPGPEQDGIERSHLDSDSTITPVFTGRRATPGYEDRSLVSPRVLSPSSTTSSSSSTPSTPQLPNVPVGSRHPSLPPWDSSTYTPEVDGRHQGAFEMAPGSSQGSSRGPFIKHKRSRQHSIRQGTEPSSPITASSSMPGTPNANAHSRAERPVGSNGSISLVQSQGRDRGRDVRDALTSALSVLHAEQRRLPMDDEDALQDDYGSPISHTRNASDKAYPQPPSPTMTVFSSLDDDLLPDFLDLEADDASSRLSHIGPRPFSILPGVAESESEPAHEYASQPRPAPVRKPHTAPVHPPRNPAQNRNDGAYADPVIPAMQPPPGPRKAQSLQNLVGPSRLALHGRPALQHSASAQRLYEHARSSPLGGPEFSKPLPRAPTEGLQRLDEEGYASPPSQHSQATSRGRRVSPLSGLPIAEPQSPSAHLGVPSYSSEQSSRSDLRPRALSSVDTQAVDNAQRRLHHSASRESGFTGTEGSSRSRSSTTSSWDFVPRRTVDPAIPPELAASRIPGTSSMLSPPATRQNFSPTSESSRPGVHRILQQHGIAGTRADYSPTALSPTALSFEQSISRRGSTRSAGARSNKSSGSSQNAVDGVPSKRRDEGSGLSDLRHKISGLLRPAATPDLSPRSPDFESGPPTPGTPRRWGKGSDDGPATNATSPGIGGLSMRSRGLVKQSSEQLASPQTPRVNPNPRQSSTTARGTGSTSPQPELESFMPDELTDKPLKKKLFGGLGW